jgi:outer membrane protein, heavy metal efflux system
MKTIHFLLFALLLFATSLKSEAQDTLRLTPSAAEQLFLQKNLSIIAQKYNVDINKAFALQAGLRDNPTVFLDQNLYDGKLFRHTQNYGEVYLQLQQLILTAGKRQKRVRIADDYTLSAEMQVNDLVRNLKYVLQTDLNNLGQLQAKALLYKKQLTDLRQLAKAMDAVRLTGDVSEKEELRVKALLFEVENDEADNIQQQLMLQTELRTLLATAPNVVIVAESLLPPSLSNFVDTAPPDFASLTATAHQNRPDLALANNQVKTQQHNLEYQLALRTPDLTFGLEYDHRNSYAPHYFGFSVGLPLLVFNKNQGNIQAAQVSIKQAEAQQQVIDQQLTNEVATAYQKWQSLQQLRRLTPPELGNRYDTLRSNVQAMYQQRQISLLEFLDFAEAYRTTQIKKINIITNLLNAAAELNFTVGAKVINY